MISVRIICLIIGYALGLIQTGYIYGKAHNVDIRQHGSGNAGTTNTLRTLGWKAGAITLLGDILKSVAAVVLAWILFHNSYPDMVKVFQLYAGLGVVLGHNYPFYLKFQGGKGIASTIGVIFSYDIRMVPICALLFFAAVIPTKYVSLGSMMILAGFMAQTVVFGQMGWLSVAAEHLPEIYVLIAIFTFLGFFRHKANIVRLANGTENKFSVKKSGR